MSAVRIGEVLVKQGLVRTDQMTKALDDQKKTGTRLALVLINQGIIKEQQLLKVMETVYSLPGIDLYQFQIQADVIQMVPRDICEKNFCIPIQKTGTGTIVVAFGEPTNMKLRDDLRFLTRCKIQPVVATELSIQTAIEKYYGSAVKAMSVQVDMEGVKDSDVVLADAAIDVAIEGSDDGTPVVRFINAVLIDAIKRRVSDIHFEPYEKRLRVRFRVDGNMVEAASQSIGSAPAIASRLKIMSKLDIAEKRKPQDGRIKIRLSNGKEMDFRVSVLPTIWGEKVVLRLLDKSNLKLDMTNLGMEPDDLVVFKKNINMPQGLVLITGPTGSGKTTTIYSALAELNKPDVNISTAEDPVEFNFEGINQVQMLPDIGLNFASALKSFLRQDPDIIMVGEIRDFETAEIAMKAASTGHLVVSTLHTNDAPQTVLRLTEMGVASYIVTSTVNLIVAQRLVGMICENCKTSEVVEPQVLINLGVDPSEVHEYNLFKGKGCGTCNNTGYKGRVAIYEMMTMTEPIREAIIKGASSSELRFLAKKEGMKTLRRAGLLKLKRGITTIEEVNSTSVKDTE